MKGERRERLESRGAVSGPQGSHPLLNMQVRAVARAFTRAARSRFSRTNEASLTCIKITCMCTIARDRQQQHNRQHNPDSMISAVDCLKAIRLDQLRRAVARQVRHRHLLKTAASRQHRTSKSTASLTAGRFQYAQHISRKPVRWLQQNLAGHKRCLQGLLGKLLET